MVPGSNSHSTFWLGCQISMANLKMTKNRTTFLCHAHIHGCPAPCSLPNPLLPHSPLSPFLLCCGEIPLLIPGSRCLSSPPLQLCSPHSRLCCSRYPGTIPGPEGACHQLAGSWPESAQRKALSEQLRLHLYALSYFKPH